MEPRRTENLRVVLVLIILHFTGSSENDYDLNFCGIWRHGNGSLSLIVNLSPGCNGISISANKSSLSIDGQITAQCRQSDVIHLKWFGLDSDEEESHFCLFWEPLLDQLKLQVRRKILTLCRPTSVQGSCCTDMVLGPNKPQAAYGILGATVNSDIVTYTTRTAYDFLGMSVNCRALCDQTSQGSTAVGVIEDTGMEFQAVGIVEHPYTRSFEVEMREDFRGYNLTSPAIQGVSAESNITVQIPPALKQAVNKTNKVRCTFFKNIFLFQDGHTEARILDIVVEINVESEVITDLPEPIKISFTHDVIPKTHSRKCVSWDPRKDPWQVSWVMDGCETRQRGTQHTECLCNHLAYFSVLVQPEPRPVCHPLALIVITSLGCAVSLISCVALIIFLYRKRSSKFTKEQSIHIHLGLAVSLAVFNLLFFFTGVLANVGGERVCAWVGAALHYTVLSFLSWMGIEVFHTFWLIYTDLPAPKPFVWNLVGFIFPVVPVFILVRVGDIYGVKAVLSCNDTSNPYLMCWMKDTHKALLAHYFTNTAVLAILVSSSTVMLFLLYRKNRTRAEWRQKRVAFLSICGLSILFGATWGLNLLDFGPLSEFVLFLSSILNSLQGFLLMLRFYVLDRMRKHAGGSSMCSTRQDMLQAKDKS